MTRQPAEPEGPRNAEDPAEAAASRSGIPLAGPPAASSGDLPASAGREHDPADARPHFTTETGTDKTSEDPARPPD